jgi:phosphoenolpyruvate carboxylase
MPPRHTPAGGTSQPVRLLCVSTASVARDRDSAELPELMRRDVRLLGDVLGEVITESDGPDLLADVERLRHAVISARQVPDRA